MIISSAIYTGVCVKCYIVYNRPIHMYIYKYGGMMLYYTYLDYSFSLISANLTLKKCAEANNRDNKPFHLNSNI